MNEEQSLAVVAGLFMGEGWVGVRKFGTNGQWWKVRLTIANTDTEITKLSQAVLGGSVNLSKNNPPDKPLYTLQIDNYRNVLHVLRRMRPFLVGRKALLADLMVQLCESRIKNGSPLSIAQSRFMGGRGGYTDSDLALIQKISFLNRRGVHPESFYKDKGLLKDSGP